MPSHAKSSFGSRIPLRGKLVCL